MYYTSQLRRGGRAVECTSLENWQRLIAFLGFKSLSLRHFLHTGIIPNISVESTASNFVVIILVSSKTQQATMLISLLLQTILF